MGNVSRAPSLGEDQPREKGEWPSPKGQQTSGQVWSVFLLGAGGRGEIRGGSTSQTLESWSVYQARPRSGAMLTAGGVCRLGAYARAILKAAVQLQQCVSKAQVCSTAGLAL